MHKKQIQSYRTRWNLVVEAENQEIREAPLELLIKQTFSIWEIARTLDFFEREEIPNPRWRKLQAAWMAHHA